MTEMPRMNRKLLFDTVRAAAPTENAQLVQAQLFGTLKRRHRHLDKVDIFEAALQKTAKLSHDHAVQRWEESGHRASIEKAEKLAYARLLAAVYTWPELFDGRRGFASVKDAYRRKRVYPDTGKKEYYKGVDSALYGLFEAGLTIPQVVGITRELLFNHTDGIRNLEINKEFPATTACQFYARAIEPALRSILPHETLGNEDQMARIDHHIIFILYAGMRRELGERQIQVYRDKARKEIEESAIHRVLDRRDVAEQIAKGVPQEQIMDALRGPMSTTQGKKRRLTNRFLV